ncbi:MAG: ImmA/IrrE family metallo-endopeptidase [Pseudomonadota bacterium]
MTRRSDPLLKVKWEADKLLQELGIDTLPVDPFEIAGRLGIALQAMPSRMGGASGMLIHVAGQFGICYPTHIESEGFKKFSVGHEIGHYRLPGHVEAVLDENGQHVSSAGFHSSSRYELEADHFAAALLMPTRLVRAILNEVGDGLSAVEAIAGECETSLEAAAIRFTHLCPDPAAVVRSQGETIEYAFMSNSLRDFDGLEWIRKGTPLPDSATREFNRDDANIRFGRRTEGSSTVEDWFGGPYRQKVLEEVAGLGSYGKTITILTGMQPPDELEADHEDQEEDEDLEESWTPRFRR